MPGFLAPILYVAIATVAFIGVLQARALLKTLNPACEVGFGGYAAAPTLTAAVHLGLNTAIHEQNAYLGRANRMLAGQVGVVCTSFDETEGIPAGAHAITTGMPVRPPVKALAGQGYAVPAADGPVRLLVMGGSQGASVFSEVVPAAIAQLPDDVQRRLVIHQQCREDDLSGAEAAYAGTQADVTLKRFFDNVPELLTGAHLVITRSGASTCAELSCAGRPSLLVPYPHAADDHQSLNARALDRSGAAWVMPQPTFTPDAVAERLGALIAAPAPLEQAAVCAAKAGRPEAASALADTVLETAGLNGGLNGGANARGAA